MPLCNEHGQVYGEGSQCLHCHPPAVPPTAREQKISAMETAQRNLDAAQLALNEESE